MNPVIHEMTPKFRRFTEEMNNDIEFYVKNGLTSATSIFPLLKAKYPVHPIYKKDLYNAIHMFRCQKEPAKNNVCNIISSLLEKKADDPE